VTGFRGPSFLPNEIRRRRSGTVAARIRTVRPRKAGRRTAHAAHPESSGKLQIRRERLPAVAAPASGRRERAPRRSTGAGHFISGTPSSPGWRKGTRRSRPPRSRRRAPRRAGRRRNFPARRQSRRPCASPSPSREDEHLVLPRVGVERGVAARATSKCRRVKFGPDVVAHQDTDRDASSARLRDQLPSMSFQLPRAIQHLPASVKLPCHFISRRFQRTHKPRYDARFLHRSILTTCTSRMPAKNAVSSHSSPRGDLVDLADDPRLPLTRSATCSASVGRAITCPRTRRRSPWDPPGLEDPNSRRRISPRRSGRGEQLLLPRVHGVVPIASRHFTPRAPPPAVPASGRSASFCPPVFPVAGVPHQREARSGAPSLCSNPAARLSSVEELLLADVVHHRALFHRLRRLPGAGEAAVAVIFPEHLLRLGYARGSPEDVVRPDRLPLESFPFFAAVAGAAFVAAAAAFGGEGRSPRSVRTPCSRGPRCAAGTPSAA